MFNPRIERLERISKAEPKMPIPTVEDIGKVPVVNEDGIYELGTVSSLPSYTSDDVGKVLKLSEESSDVIPVWGEVSSFPEVASSDVGKTLIVTKDDPVYVEVIPEQNVTTTTETTAMSMPCYSGVISNANISKINTTDMYTLIADGVEYDNVQFSNDGSDLLLVELSAQVGIRLKNNVCEMITFTNNETHEIELHTYADAETASVEWGFNPCIITVTLDHDTQTWVPDKTYAELEYATNNNIPIYARYTSSGVSSVWKDVNDDYYSTLWSIFFDSYSNVRTLRFGTLKITSQQSTFTWTCEKVLDNIT